MQKRFSTFFFEKTKIFHLFKFYDIIDLLKFNHYGWCVTKLMDISLLLSFQILYQFIK